MANVPFPGTMAPGARGGAVGPMQTALRRWGVHQLAQHPEDKKVRKYGPTGVWGKPTTAQLKHYQDAAGLPQTGWYGPKTHNKLAKWYSDSGARILQAIHAERQEKLIRARMVYNCRSTAGFNWIYSGPGSATIHKRMDIVRNKITNPRRPGIFEDCSSGATGMAWLSKAPDPNRNGYAGWGNTTTMIANRPHLRIWQLKPGDYVFYGTSPFNITHVAVYLGGGMVWTFGSEPGPRILPINYRPWSPAQFGTSCMV